MWRGFTCPTQITAALAAVAALASGCTHDIAGRQAIDSIAAQIPSERAALLNRLEVAPNTSGQGVLVFVGSTRSCRPDYCWIVLGNGHSYTLNEESRNLTPNLLRLADAPAEHKNRAGFDRPGFASEVQNVVCQKTRG